MKQERQIGENIINHFHPCLTPNFKVGEPIEWGRLIFKPHEWLVSEKLDGVRIEIFHEGPAYSRTLKAIPSTHVQKMCKGVQEKLTRNQLIEAELWSPDLNFSEIIHFVKTEDITSPSTRSKYEKLWVKSNGGRTDVWPFPGRDVDFCCTWPESLKFYAFDFYDDNYPERVKFDRFKVLADMIIPELEIVPQKVFLSVEEIYDHYMEVVANKGEGLMLIHKNAPYKFGRFTVRDNYAYKMKNDKTVYKGVITGVFESTVAKDGTEKTVDAFGHSKTSQLKEDRELSGMAGGFEVWMSDGRELKVSLNGYNTEQKIALLKNASHLKGKEIEFTGMPPVKVDGVPRHAFYTKKS